MRKSSIAVAVVAAAILAGGLSGCGSSPSSTQTASTQAASAQTPVTTAPVTTAPVTQASSPEPDAPPSANPATTMELWCGPVFNIVQYSSLAQWRADANVVGNVQGSVVLNLQTTLRGIESMATPGGPDSAAADVVLFAQALCEEVRLAYEAPPPADLGDYDTAMADFLEASQFMRSVPGGTASSTEEAVRPSLNAGTTVLNAFLAAIGATPSSAPAATVAPAAAPSPYRDALGSSVELDQEAAWLAKVDQGPGCRRCSRLPSSTRRPACAPRTSRELFPA
jgi:hypothetical protein